MSRESEARYAIYTSPLAYCRNLYGKPYTIPCMGVGNSYGSLTLVALVNELTLKYEPLDVTA